MAGIVDIPVINTPKHSESVSHLTDFLRVSEKVLLLPLAVLSIGESHLDGRVHLRGRLPVARSEYMPVAQVPSHC